MGAKKRKGKTAESVGGMVIVQELWSKVVSG